MAKIPEYFNIGSVDDMTQERLIEILQEIYSTLAIAVNKKPDIIQQAASDGDPTDVSLSNGDVNINLTTNKVEMLTNHSSATTVTWTTLS